MAVRLRQARRKKHEHAAKHMNRGFRCRILVLMAAAWSITILYGAMHLEVVLCQAVDPPAPRVSLPKFVDELLDMPHVKGYHEDDGGVLSPASLTIGMFETEWKYHRDLPSTTVFAFGESRETATVPGPTIHARRGISTHITWENHLYCKHLFPCDPTLEEARPRSGKGIPTVVHLHGGKNEPTSDGHALAWFTAGFRETGPTWKTKLYHYPNVQFPGNMWYHDHAMGLTRINLLAGLFGSYVLHDPPVEDAWDLPSGRKYDRNLLICDRGFYKNGTVYFYRVGDNPKIHPEWQPEYFGDVIVVNGKAWPYMRVERRRYRFRIVNVSNARFFRFALRNGLPFTQIGSDSNYLPVPVVVRNILLAPSEQADVIIDFSKSTTDEIVMTNSAVYPFPSGDPANEQSSKVMKFILAAGRYFPTETVDRSSLPQRFFSLPDVRRLKVSRVRQIALMEYESNSETPTHLLLNGLPFDAPATETPEAGSTELWHIINLTEDNHPLHLHLADVLVLEQREVTDSKHLEVCVEHSGFDNCNVWRYVAGRRFRPPLNEAGWKNVIKCDPGRVTSFLARFALLDNRPFPFNASAEPGYSYHCHILDHEDNQMMRPLKILP